MTPMTSADFSSFKIRGYFPLQKVSGSSLEKTAQVFVPQVTSLAIFHPHLLPDKTAKFLPIYRSLGFERLFHELSKKLYKI